MRARTVSGWTLALMVRYAAAEVAAGQATSGINRQWVVTTKRMG
jgi:hypothetical protein